MIATYSYPVYHHSTDALIGRRLCKAKVSSLEEAIERFSCPDGSSYLETLDGKPIHTFFPKEPVDAVAGESEDNIPF